MGRKIINREGEARTRLPSRRRPTACALAYPVMEGAGVNGGKGGGGGSLYRFSRGWCPQL